MEIKKLHSEVIAKIKSSSTISNVTQCLTELVLNSLDAKSTAIAVRVNLVTFRLQVVDNGDGIGKKNLESVGLRYMTNKCNTLEQLEKEVKYYGFRGETLASIIDISKTVEITSRHIHSSETLSKTFGNRIGTRVVLVKSRPSCGTTITVEDFLYNLPIRKNRIVPELELEDIKKNIEYLIIMHPKVSFSIRNDVTGNLVMNSKKNKDIISSFRYLHPKIDAEYSLMKVKKNKVLIEALLFKGLFENKNLQYVYVNKRPVYCPKVQKSVTNFFHKKQKYEGKKSLNNLIVNQKSRYPAYVINIKCPHSSVDILLNPSKTMVEFKNWNTVLHSLEKLVHSFLGTDKKLTKNDKYLTTAKDVKSDCGVSQMCGAYKAYGYKRNSSGKDEFVPQKVQKFDPEIMASDIIEDTQFTTKPSRKGDMTHKDITPPENLLKNDVESDISKILFSEVSIDCINVDENIEKIPDNHGIKVKYTENQHINFHSSNNIYINDLKPPAKRTTKTFRKPLPIKVSHRSKNNNFPIPKKKNPNKYSNINISSYNNEIVIDQENIANDMPCNLKKVVIPQNLDSEKSFFSKFTNDENKGKDLIMDMFLKSTQVYISDEDIQSDVRSEETIFEVESNFLVENNFQTNVNGISKTMSASVNIRSTKKIRKSKTKVNKKVSKCVQTSLDDDKMVSKCIQTTMGENCVGIKKRHKNEEKFPANTKLTENYTIVFSDTVRSNKAPKFKFVYKNPPVFKLKLDNLDFLEGCKCGCQVHNQNVFDFNSLKYQTNRGETPSSILNKVIDFSETNFDLEKDILSPIELEVTDKEQNKSFNNNIVNIQQPQEWFRSCNNADNFICKKNHHLLDKPCQEFFTAKECKTHKNLHKNECEKSPYFSSRKKYIYDQINVRSNPVKNKLYSDHTTDNANQSCFYKLFNPQFRSTQLSYGYNSNQNHGTDFCDALGMLHDFNIDNFGQFQPLYKSTQHTLDTNMRKFDLQFGDNKRIIENTENIYGGCLNFNHCRNNIRPNFENLQHDSSDNLKNYVNNDNLNFRTELMNISDSVEESDRNKKFFANGHVNHVPGKTINANLMNQIPKTPGDQSKLVITLSNQQKQKILERELEAEKDINEKKFLDWCSQLPVSMEEKKIEYFESDWVKKFNNCGTSFYVNKRTGFTTFFTPKQNPNQFRFNKRFEFMPKGLSPILKDIKAVDNSLSQNKKDLLQNYILESYQDDLLIIKWQKYIKNNDPKTFFDEVYKEKVKQFGNYIPGISTVGNTKCLTELDSIISFDKALFDTVSIIGQLDRKFIVVLEKTKNLLILFDQHAVHERIRLEDLLEAYSGVKTECEEKFILFIPQNDLVLLRKHEVYLNSLGLTVEFFENGITVSEIPLCLYHKFKHNVKKSENLLNEAIRLFINEIINLLKATRGVPLKSFPPIIQNILNLEACRGAIKFGDRLNKINCAELLEKLSVCKLPFQCAHGRPTLVPLLALDLTKKPMSSSLNLKKLLDNK